MKFSVIIPVHNAQATLKSCLDSLAVSRNRDFEVIIIDDKSSDASVDIARAYPYRVIILEENKGTAFCRNRGRDNAKGEILVFIDADVAIKKDSLDIIDKSFREQDIVAVTGLLSRECPYSGFFSQYKNLYMHYIFKRCPRFVDFLYGSIIAIDKEAFLPFDESFRVTDDTELGQRYKQLNKKILLNHDLQVVHLKRYGFKGILKNDFFVPFWWAKSFILHQGYRDILRKGRFSHARASQLMSIFVAYLLVVFLPALVGQRAWIIPVGLLIIFLVLNGSFFGFLYREKGFLFSAKSAAFTFLDSLVLGLAAAAGFCYFLIRRKPREH